MKYRGIIICVTLSAFAIYLGMRFYAQYRPISLYVSKVAPMPAELASGLHVEEHKIDSLVTIESNYNSAEEKLLSMDEIRRIRSQIAWSGKMSPFIDSLTIQSATQVLARRTTSRTEMEYQFIKENDRWAIKSATHSKIQHKMPEKN